MLASPQTKMVKTPDKKPGISDRSSFLCRCGVKFQFVWQKLCYNIPSGRAASKACWLMWFIHKIPKIVCVFVQDVPYGMKACVFLYRNANLSTTCQCWKLKLNPLSMQINIYCLMTNQTPVLLVQHALWMQAAVMLLQCLYFSHLPPPRAIIPDACPLGTFENQDGRH